MPRKVVELTALVKPGQRWLTLLANHLASV